MKRVKNSDIKFKINKKLVYLPNFVIRFYTVNQKEYFFEKTQDDLVEYEREATVDDVEVILSGGTTVTEYYLPLNWSELLFVGQGILNYKLTNNIEDPEFPDYQYNKEEVVTTDFYIDSIKVDPEPDESLIERVIQLEEHLDEEIVNREEADAAISGAVDSEIARAISAETALDVKIDDEIERAISAETLIVDALEEEANRAISAETALDAKIDQEIADRTADVNAEEARAINAESALTDTINAEANRAISAETALDTKIDAEANRATSAETALQTAINDEATARANADTALQTAITNEESRAREAESGITNALNAEVTRATGAENALDTKIDAETTRATGAEAALDVKIDTVSGNVISETTRATTAENALSGAIDSISAATSGSVEELSAKIDTVSGNVITEEARAKGVEDALSGAIDTIDAKFIDDAKYEDSGNTKVINFYNGNTVKATIDATDFIKDGMISTVELIPSGSTSVLVITWNTDGGSKVTTIDIGDIFEADNYYQKSETSGATEIANAIDAVSGAIPTQYVSNIGKNSDNGHTRWFDVYKNGVNSLQIYNFSINGRMPLTKQNGTDANIDNFNLVETSDFTAHTNDSTIHLTSGDIQSLIDSSISGKANSNDVYLKTETSGATQIATALADKLDTTAYTPTDLSNYYTKSETSGKTEISTALAGKVDSSSIVSSVTSASTDSELPTAKAVYDALGQGGGGISSAECQTMIDNSIDVVNQVIEDNEEVTAQALNVLNGELANKLDVSAYTPVDLSNYYTKSETSGATEISTALSNKLDATAYTPTDLSNYYTKSETSGKTEISTALASKANSSDVYTKSETSGTTELATAFAATQPKLSAGTGISIDANNVISATGGTGGKAIEAGRGISVATGETADTVSFNLPISAGTGVGSIIGGRSGNIAIPQASFAFGESNQITYDCAYASIYGYGNHIYPGSTGAHIAGVYNEARNGAECAVGKNNVSNTGSTNADKTLFSVGNGTNNKNRHNAFEIRQNGDIYLTKDGQDVKLQDQLGGAGGGISSAECQTMIDQSISGKTNQSDFTGHTADTTIHVTAQDKTNWNNKSDFSGDYNDLTNKPTIPTVPTNVSDFTNDAGYITSNDISGKTNQSDFTAHTANTSIHVTTAQTAAWDAKSDFSGSYNDLTNKLSAGTNITIVDNVISATGGGGGGSYTAGRGIDITSDVISVSLPISAGTGNYSIIEGGSTSATSECAHAEGWYTKASGARSHAEGYGTVADNDNAHVEGYYTIANNNSEHACGKYNVSRLGPDGSNTLFSVGNGTAENARHNALEVRENGDIYFEKNGSDVKLQDVIPTTTSAVTSGSTAVLTSGGAYEQFGGLKLQQISQSDYENLPTKDSSTLYIII